jgi:hypothetical protein
LNAPESGQPFAVEFIMDGFTQRLGERSLAGAGIVFQQHVAVGEYRGEHQIDDFVAPFDCAAQPLPQAIDDVFGLRDAAGKRNFEYRRVRFHVCISSFDIALI